MKEESSVLPWLLFFVGSRRSVALAYFATLLQSDLVGKAPRIDNWPGDFATPPQLVKVDIEINSYQTYEEIYFSGYYLPAGQEAMLKVT